MEYAAIRNYVCVQLIPFYRVQTHRQKTSSGAATGALRPLHAVASKFGHMSHVTVSHVTATPVSKSHATGLAEVYPVPARTPGERTPSSEVADDSVYFNLDAVENAALQAQADVVNRHRKHLLKISSSLEFSC